MAAVRSGLALLAAWVAVTSLVACGGRQQNTATDQGAGSCEITTERRIGIATGNTGGVYYVLGGGFAESVSTATGGKLKATAAETGASVQNIQQLVAGKYQVAFSLADTAADAVNGTGTFTSKQPITALARLYSNFTQLVVRTDAGITSLADLRGKRVSTGSPKSGTEVIANRILQAAGLDPGTDLAAQRLDIGTSVDGMKDGTIDAMFFSGGLPTPNLTDLFTSLGTKVRLLDTSGVLSTLKGISPGYDLATIPASTYPNATDTPTIVVPNLLVAPQSLDAATACVLTRTLFEHRADLMAINPAAAGIILQRARETDPVPLHPGAKQALDTLGAP
ncbi:MAG: TAXI family TRAP transporter solute-binding subunit [Pseudonocardiaceae bacterium]